MSCRAFATGGNDHDLAVFNARWELPTVPARFRLVMASDRTVHECRVIWIQKNRIGLTFVAVPRESERESQDGESVLQ